MKRRHPSEDVFFELMADYGFQRKNIVYFPLPGDEDTTEENIELYIYTY